MLPWVDGPGWGCNPSTSSDCGPALDEQPLQVYGFEPESAYDLTGLDASKHYAIYLAQYLLRGLLVHDVELILSNYCHCFNPP